MTPEAHSPRIGIDLGGTKIAGILFGAGDTVQAEMRRPSPQRDYPATIAAIVETIGALEQNAAVSGATIGIGMPGSISPRSGVVHNANSTWLNGKPFDRDLQAAIGRPVRLSNDANCFALSEAYDGAAAGAKSVFGVIIGTGCGGGVVVGGRLVDGPHGIAGEWGHIPLPWAEPSEHPGPKCWCGQFGCLETWVSGTALADDHARATGLRLASESIVARADAGDAEARSAVDRHADRLARGLALITNILDPEVIVLGGGLSKLPHLYDVLPRRMGRWMFADHAAPDIRAPRWGDASGVRGAARLWA
jgi:fructokinase